MFGVRKLLGIGIALSLAACGARRSDLEIGPAATQKQQQDSDGHLYTPLDTENDSDTSNATSTTQATSSSSGSNNSSSGTTTSINNGGSYSGGGRVNISILVGKWHGQCDLAAVETVIGV